MHNKKKIRRLIIGINPEKTGMRIKQIVKEQGYTVRDLMEITGIMAKQSIYKWYSGENLPSYDNLFTLSTFLEVSAEDLIVLDGKDAPCCEDAVDGPDF